MRPFKLLLLVFALALSGCGDSEQAVQAVKTQPAQPAADKARIALVMKTLTNPFFIEMEKALAGRKRNLE